MRSFKKYILILVLSICSVFALFAADKSWKSVATEMQTILLDSLSIYSTGDSNASYERVNDAYFGHYEVDGFERNTQSRIGGSRAGNVEVQFSRIKGAMRDGKSYEEVEGLVNTLIDMLFEDASKLDPPEMSWTELSNVLSEEFEEAANMYLDGHVVTAEPKFRKAYARYYGKSKLQENVFKKLGAKKDNAITEKYEATKSMILNRESKAETAASIRELSALISKTALELTRKQNRGEWWGSVFASLMILLREGFEAILIVGAIIAYLRKSGTEDLKPVYRGSLWGIAASVVMALILIGLTKFGFESGQGQEVVEGVTMFIAVAVLFYTSNWMLSKSETDAWNAYIKGKVRKSTETGSVFALAFTAFLAVFREGAEVVLFYQPMLNEGNPGMVWAGFGVGCVVLVFVYLAITKLSIRLPIKVFFTATSILMAVMCVAFLGSGIKELAEGNLFDLTLRVPGIPENDVIQIFGIYPWLETLVPQLILSIILLITFLMAHYRGKIDALKAQYNIR